MSIDLESRCEISEYSLEDLEKFRDEKGFIDLSKIGIEFNDDTREFVGNQDRTKNWVSFNGVQTLIKGEAKIEEGTSNYGIYAELIVEELSKLYNIPSAHYDLVKMRKPDGEEELGVLSVSVVDKSKGEYLESLASLVGYEKTENMYETSTSYEFTIERLRERLEKDNFSEEEIEKQLTEYQKRLAYYMIIADGDRHPENVAFIRDKTGLMQMSPVFDSESALLMDTDIETLKDLSGSIGNIIENSNYVDPRIATINSSKENESFPWKDTFQELLKNEKVRKYCLETLASFKNEYDVEDFYDKAIQNVEKRIKAKIPEEARAVSKMIYMYRVEEVAKLLDREIEVDEITGGYFSKRNVGESGRDILSSIIGKGTGEKKVGLSEIFASLQSLGIKIGHSDVEKQSHDFDDDDGK